MAVPFWTVLVRLAGMALLFSTVLFMPAGTLRWPAAWIFMALFFAFTLALSLWLARFNPDLLAERMSGIGHEQQKRWDKVLLRCIAVAFFGCGGESSGHCC